MADPRQLKWTKADLNGHPSELSQKRWLVNPGDQVTLHTHDFAEVFWVFTGKGFHQVNERRIPLACGDLWLIRPRDRHGITAAGEQPFGWINVAFSAATLRFIRKRYFAHDPQFYGGTNRLPQSYRLTPADLKWLEEQFQGFRDVPSDQLEIDRFLLSLFRRLSIRAVPSSNANVPDWLHRGIQLARRPEHLTGGTSAFARLCGRSPEHVAREVRRHFSCRPTDLMTRMRLDHAAYQLATSTMPIVDICSEIGFDSLAHFYKVFRARFGDPPLKYRKAHSLAR